MGLRVDCSSGGRSLGSVRGSCPACRKSCSEKVQAHLLVARLQVPPQQEGKGGESAQVHRQRLRRTNISPKVSLPHCDGLLLAQVLPPP